MGLRSIEIPQLLEQLVPRILDFGRRRQWMEKRDPCDPCECNGLPCSVHALLVSRCPPNGQGHPAAGRPRKPARKSGLKGRNNEAQGASPGSPASTMSRAECPQETPLPEPFHDPLLLRDHPLAIHFLRIPVPPRLITYGLGMPLRQLITDPIGAGGVVDTGEAR